MRGREIARPREESFHFSFEERSRSRLDLRINMAFPRDQFNVFVVLDENGLQAGRVLEQAPAGEKMLVEEAAVRSLDAAQLARIQNIEGHWGWRHTWTLTQPMDVSTYLLLACLALSASRPP
jgi:hypothetical protein